MSCAPGRSRADQPTVRVGACAAHTHPQPCWCAFRARARAAHAHKAACALRAHAWRLTVCGRVGLTAARFKPNPHRGSFAADGCGRFVQSLALRVDELHRFGQAAGHAPVSRNKCAAPIDTIVTSTNASFGAIAIKSVIVGAVPRHPVVAPSLLLLTRCRRSRPTIPAEAEPDNRDAMRCSSI